LFLDYENNLAEFRYAKEQIKGNETNESWTFCSSEFKKAATFLQA
jgi:hypothetical protein